MNCPKCGANSPPENNFCGKCGSTLPILQTLAPVAKSSEPRERAPQPSGIGAGAFATIVLGLTMVLFAIVVIFLSFGNLDKEKKQAQSGTLTASLTSKPTVKNKPTLKPTPTPTETPQQRRHRLAEARQRAREEKQRQAREEAAQRKVRAAELESEHQSTSSVRRELPSYEKAGENWRNILIRPNTDQEDLIKLARKFHQEDPSSNFRFLDDDEQFQEFMDWDKNYPDSSYPSPEDWIDKHYIAMVNRLSGTWSLNSQYGETIASLE